MVENPYTQPHYLTTYFPVKPKLIDKDRSAKGDYFKKPTQYWFVNCEPSRNFVMEPMTYVESGGRIENPKKVSDKCTKTIRSIISPHYARRFILEHIIDGEEGVVYGTSNN